MIILLTVEEEKGRPTVTAPDGGVTRYNYDDPRDSQLLETITPNGTGGYDTFTYTAPLLCGQGNTRARPLKSIQYPGQSGVVSNHNGSGSRILKQTLADGAELKFSYTVVGACSAQLSCAPFTPIACGIDPTTGRKVCHP